MRIWIPVALVLVVLLAYALFYLTELLESEGASSLAVINTVGVAAVVLGIVAAFVVLRRVRPP